MRFIRKFQTPLMLVAFIGMYGWGYLARLSGYLPESVNIFYQYAQPAYILLSGIMFTFFLMFLMLHISDIAKCELGVNTVLQGTDYEFESIPDKYRHIYLPYEKISKGRAGRVTDIVIDTNQSNTKLTLFQSLVVWTVLFIIFIALPLFVWVSTWTDNELVRYSGFTFAVGVYILWRMRLKRRIRKADRESGKTIIE